MLLQIYLNCISHVSIKFLQLLECHYNLYKFRMKHLICRLLQRFLMKLVWNSGTLLNSTFCYNLEHFLTFFSIWWKTDGLVLRYGHRITTQYTNRQQPVMELILVDYKQLWSSFKQIILYCPSWQFICYLLKTSNLFLCMIFILLKEVKSMPWVIVLTALSNLSRPLNLMPQSP